jgi:molybdopterin/thiamine biosynthesis adenylyltransferase
MPKNVATYCSRLEGIVSSALREKVILLCGLGAGSYFAEKFARLAPRKLILVDKDRVELPNLSRTAYTYDDAQRARTKVEALAERIRSINPFVELEEHAADVLDLRQRVPSIFNADLIVAGTDQLNAQAALNAVAVERGIPAVFVGIHPLAEGGRVIWHVPGMPCYRCVARERFVPDASPDIDAAIGGLIDCQFIDMVALKIAVAILERDQDSAMGAFYRAMNGRNEIIVRCSPSYAWGTVVWNALLADLPHAPKDYAAEINEYLVAMDTLWLAAGKDPSCPVCGSTP